MDSDRLVKFGVIVLCLLNSFYSKDGFSLGKRDGRLLQIAMGLTVLADLFMVIYGLNIQGIGAFCIVQIVHNYRFTNIERVKIQIIFGGLIYLAVYFLGGHNMLMALAAAYIVFSLYSLGGAFMAFREFPKPNNIILLFGMILFALCDVFVLIYNSPIGFFQANKPVIMNLIWLCYLPGQVLISSSAKRIKSFEES